VTAIKPACDRYGKTAHPQFVRQNGREMDEAARLALPVRASLTRYALNAMVHCNIFFLQRTIPMSCFVLIKGGTTAAGMRCKKGNSP
jgi:hypothetical protein